MSTRTTPSASPSEARRRRTIGDLMAIVGVVALYAWLLRVLVSGEPTLIPLLLMLLSVMTHALFGASLRTRRSYWHGDNPSYERIDPCSDQVPPQVAEDIVTTVPRMEALGFRSLGSFRNADSVPNVTLYVSLFANTSSRRTAQRITTIVGVGPPQEPQPYLAILTDFTDGTCLITDNSEGSLICPPRFFRRGSMSFSRATGLRRLFEIHEASTAHYAAEGVPCEPRTEDPAEYLRADQQRMLARIAEAGFFQHDAARPVYHLTWKGALLVTWKHKWPIKPIRQMVGRRRARRLLRELGLDWSTGST